MCFNSGIFYAILILLRITRCNKATLAYQPILIVQTTIFLFTENDNKIYIYYAL